MFRFGHFNFLFSLQLEAEATQTVDFYQLCYDLCLKEKKENVESRLQQNRYWVFLKIKKKW